MTDRRPLGATVVPDDRCEFHVWAPAARELSVHLLGPAERLVPMEAGPRGYFSAIAENVRAGDRYFYRLNGHTDRPDPASHAQPQGVHGPSQVVDSRFDWTDAAWIAPPLSQWVIYELHVGTFTDDGTFEAVIAQLPRLRDLGVTVIELMPVAQFPGSRNWGYDGVYPFAVQHSYGGVHGLKTLVDACHRCGLAVALDVVYNHIGPEGNYLSDFGPYFTERYRTPWGRALNFDGPGSDEVRRFFIDNAVSWVREYHIDGLRLDAIHAIVDPTARPFVGELAAAVHAAADALNRRVQVVAETDQNDPSVVRPREAGGIGCDAQWSDDVHHALHRVLTGERTGYYRDFGGIGHLARAFRHSYVYTGQYSVHRGRRHGADPVGIPPRRFIVCAQNHDQVGNRMIGDRLTTLVDLASLKLAAAAVILSPFTPLLFMGEEYGEPAPFPFFVSHSDRDLIEAVRRGRREEFAAFDWKGEPPDPQSEETFRSARLNHALRSDGRHACLQEFYRELLALRRTPPFSTSDDSVRDVCVLPGRKALWLHWRGLDSEAIMVLNFDDAPATVPLSDPAYVWTKRLDSDEVRWCGAGGSPPPAVDPATSAAALVVNPRTVVVLARAESP